MLPGIRGQMAAPNSVTGLTDENNYITSPLWVIPVVPAGRWPLPGFPGRADSPLPQVEPAPRAAVGAGGGIPSQLAAIG